MLNDVAAARERWGGVHDIIDRWLQERQQLLVQFCGLTPQPANQSNAEREQALRSFCQILVDYVSAGHFEIYEKLVEEGRSEGNEEGLAHARRFYATIDATTEIILDFNDKYQETDDLTTLTADLSALGESLATRFEAEDSMIEVLHTAHREPAA